MKNIEKIAIDSLLASIEKEKAESITEMATSKKAFEEAKKNFQQAANALVGSIKAGVKEISDELSEEATAYLESEASTKFGIPFKLK